MTEQLTTGGYGVLGHGDGMGAIFSYPSPVYVPGQGYTSDGMVWLGLRPMVGRDVKALEDAMGKQGVAIDPASEVGRLHKDWTSRHYSEASNIKIGAAIPGGKFSMLYRLEHVPWGVQFTYRPTWLQDDDSDKMWKERSLGVMFHTVNVGDGYQDLIAGPEPGSKAADFIEQGGSFQYDDVAERWRAYNANGKVVNFRRHQHAYDVAEKLGHPIED